METFDSPEMLKAIEELESGNYPVAANLLVPLAEAGNPRAQCNLAALYSSGLGVTLNGPKAIELYASVAERGITEGHLSAIACNNLATIYLTGIPGVRPDPDKAQEYLNRARKLGFGI